MRKLKKPGFTLVELLVVIGIISVLVGILLPALSRVNAHSLQIKCASSVRQIGVFISTYAAENRDAVPIGVITGGSTAANSFGDPVSPQYDFNYTVFWSNSGGRDTIGLGYLVGMRSFKTPQLFYCPAYVGQEQWSFDTPVNQWAYNYTDAQGRPFTPNSAHTRVNLSARPTAGFFAVDRDDNTNRLRGRAVILEYPNAANPPAGRWRLGFPQLSEMKNRAILSDININPGHVMRLGHKTGINVYYANGSTKYVKLGEFEDARFGSTRWAALPDNGGGNFTGDTALNNTFLNNRPNRQAGVENIGLWNLLDRAGR